MTHAELIHDLVARWNGGDLEGAFELYADDAEIRTGAHWPERTTYRGRDAIRATSEEWASTWETLRIELEGIEERGDQVVATGSWVMRGAASQIEGQMPIAILFTIRDGKIAVLEWFPDREQAVAAAGGA